MSTNPFDTKVFGNKSVSDLFKEIHTKQNKKEKLINKLIAQLQPMITDLGDAAAVVPLVKEYLEVGVKNDEHLIKMTAIVQRMLNSVNTGEGSGNLTEQEREELDAIISQANQVVPTSTTPKTP